MKKVFILVLYVTGLFVVQLNAQSPVCGAATEFCAVINRSFPAGTNSPNPSAGNDYGCLPVQPNPSWFYLRTSDTGSAVIDLISTPSVDIDFALWGPFSSLSDALGNCGSLGSPVDCSYESSTNETISLSSGRPGEYFLLLITNFSNQPTQISGHTTSSILSCNACLAEGGNLTPDNQVGCFATLDNIEADFGALTPSTTEFGYNMVVKDPATGLIIQEFIGTTLSPGLLGPGTFSVCGISYDYESAPATFIGQNYDSIQADLASAMPSFCGDFSDGCVDVTILLAAPTAVISIASIVDASVQFEATLVDVDSYLWDFGDGNTSTTEDPLHTYVGNGSYAVTFTATNECGEVEETLTVDILVSGLGGLPESAEFNIFPNPTGEIATWELRGVPTESVTLVITDVLGREVKREHYGAASAFRQNLSFMDLAAGTYVVGIIAESYEHQVRVVKQ